MKPKIAAAILGIAVLAAAWFLLRGSPGSPRESPSSAPGNPPIPRADPRTGTAESRANPTKTAGAREEAATESKPAPAAAEPGAIRGQFVREGGAPAAGLDVELGAWPPDETRRRSQYSKPAWISERTKTDADGRFSFRFAPPSSLAFWVKSSGLGLETFEWRCQQLAAGETKDLGTIVLRAGAVIVGKL